MIYKKNILVYSILSVCLIGIAVLLQLILPDEIAAFSVPILIGAATGIIATLVSTYLENNHILKKKIYLFEKETCHILGRIYNIANIDFSEDIQEVVKNNIFELIDHFDNLQDVAEEVNDLLVSKKRKKRLQTIIKQIEPMYVFYLFEYKPPKNIRKHAKDNADEIATFEALKAIKYAKAFNPQPILEQIKNSPNNVIRNFTDKEELFNIIFEKSVFSAERQAASEEFMKVEIEELEKLYEDYNIDKVRSIVEGLPSQNWAFQTKTSRRNQKAINRITQDEENSDEKRI